MNGIHSSGLLRCFAETFGSQEASVFRAPGRIEIGGNHTDHQGGHVLAASIDRSTSVAAAANGRPEVRIISEQVSSEINVSLEDLRPRPEGHGEASELVRGLIAGFERRGFEIGGFNAYISADVPIGLGLSSSASFEVALGAVVSHLFNGGQVPLLTLAQIGQEAEQLYFGKPCGLMDQIACAFGGIVAIDFGHPEKPEVHRVNVDFAAQGLDILVVDTGSDHADLSHEYAAIPAEMTRLARALGYSRCRDVPRSSFEAQLGRLRHEVGGRAMLRVLHFLAENQRVLDQVAALERGDIGEFLRLVQASGDSSWKWLQNCYPAGSVEQGIPLALALAELFLAEHERSAWRVLGGGFAGAIEVFLPTSATAEFQSRMEEVFGPGAVSPIKITSHRV